MKKFFIFLVLNLLASVIFVPTLLWTPDSFSVGIFAAEMVDINTASLAQLDTLVGIGPVYAQRIIDGRPYSSVDDLIRVNGIGEKTLQKIKDQGLACVNCAQSISIDENQNSQNSNNQTTTEQTPNIQDLVPSTQNLTPIIYPSEVYINEILPSPEGPDETEEWIELYNDNKFEIDLGGWKIQDSIGTITTFVLPEGTKIGTKGYLVLRRPQTKIVMNNSDDKLVLYQPDGNILNSVEYEKATIGFSYNRIGSNWKWSSKLTPGVENIIESASPLRQTKKQSDNTSDNIEDKLAADLTASANDAKPFSFLFFSAILLAIILVIIFFVIKNKTWK